MIIFLLYQYAFVIHIWDIEKGKKKGKKWKMKNQESKQEELGEKATTETSSTFLPDPNLGLFTCLKNKLFIKFSDLSSRFVLKRGIYRHPILAWKVLGPWPKKIKQPHADTSSNIK